MLVVVVVAMMMMMMMMMMMTMMMMMMMVLMDVPLGGPFATIDLFKKITIYNKCTITFISP